MQPGACPLIHLRHANLADAAILREWDEQPHVVASDPNDDWNWEVELLRRPHWREQLIAEADGVPIGFVQIIDPHSEDSHYWGDIETGLRAIDIWIGPPDCLGRGLGTRIMHQALARCFAAPRVRAVLIDPLASNTRAHRFYERSGFRCLGPRNFGEDACLVYRLERADFAFGQ